LSDTDDVAAFVPNREARGVKAEWGVDALERAADGNAEDPIDINGNSDENVDSGSDDENEVCCCRVILTLPSPMMRRPLNIE
jgi:hypothetical protein